jgi:cobalamin biosynthesis Co2+ chelatase CbiK
MKKILGLVCLALPVMAMAGDNNQAVSASFHSMYPYAKMHEVQVINKETCVNFHDNGKKYEAWFTNSGLWERTERRVPMAMDLPSDVRRGFKNSEYKDYKVDRMREVTAPGHHNFQVWVEKKDHGKVVKNDVLYFNQEGQLIKVDRNSMLASL